MANTSLIKEGEDTFALKARHLDIKTGHPWVVIINEIDSKTYGIHAGDEIIMFWNNHQTQVSVDLTKDLIQRGEIGLFADIIEKLSIEEGEIIKVKLAPLASSLPSIQKKLLNKPLTYHEIQGLINDIVNYHLDDIQIAFFIASAFSPNGFSNEEIYYLTKAIAETGEMFYWDGVVADKHSIGGVPGNRTTPIVVSLISSLGFKIPKTSSRAITSEAGTADVIEAVSPVEFTSEQIKKIVNETNGCLVWGGALKVAPADDRILRVSYELGIEPYSKMIISIMAKKVAMGATHLVIDMPMGPGLKISKKEDAIKVQRIFEYLAKKFNIKIKIINDYLLGPVGRGIGPNLEIRDILKVLMQEESRPLDLETRAVRLASALVELINKVSFKEAERIIYDQLKTGKALAQFRKIIEAQGGIKDLSLEKVKLGEITYEFKSKKTGIVKSIDNQMLIRIARLLGSPITKEAGVYLNKILNDRVNVNDTLCTLYTTSESRLTLALSELLKKDLYQIQ
ncbi:MAG: thymidine phosphorylase [Minisyncoccia bacterium]|jgi:AMP phosphorylase